MEDVNQLALFPLGKIVVTKGVHSAVPTDDLLNAVLRHAQGDWGDGNDEDHLSNDEALMRQFRLRSVYHTSDMTKFWIITDHERSYTTILLPDEF